MYASATNASMISVSVPHLFPKGLDMESNGRFHVGEGLFVSVPFAYYYSSKAQRIGDIPIGMLFNDYLELSHKLTLHFGTLS